MLLYNSHRKELSGGFRRTTNNRMEIFAAIAGLEALKEPCRVTLFSDSQYLVHAIQKGMGAPMAGQRMDAQQQRKRRSIRTFGKGF